MQVVAQVPTAGPVPPPIIVVSPAAMASCACCGQMKWMCVSMPPAVRINPSPAMTSVVTPTIMSCGDARHHIGIARFADAGDEAVFDADIGFVDAGAIDDERVGDDAIERVVVADAGGLAHAFANDFAAAEFAFVAVNGEIVFDLQESEVSPRRTLSPVVGPNMSA